MHEMGESKLDALLDFLGSQDTRAFIILHRGKMVLEEYWGEEADGVDAFDQDSYWSWASASKTLTATLVGIAQSEGYLSITDPTSKHLGTGWTSLSADQEDDILLSHQLTMTTGLDYSSVDNHCTDPECLLFRSPPGTDWNYHNAPYTLLTEVVSSAAGVNYNDFTEDKIGRHTGMSGRWISSGYNIVYWSTPRDMARFGLLMYSKGKWASNLS